MITLSKRRIAILLIGLLWVGPAAAGHCLEDWACWEVKKSEGKIEFWVKNLKDYSFTGSLDVKTRNLRTASTQKVRYAATRVIKGNSEVLLLTLYPIDQYRSTAYEDIFYWTPGNLDSEHDANVGYQLPFAEGEHFPLVQGFGGGYSHRGASRYAVDFAMPVGSKVHAARSGVVVQTVAHHDRGGASRRYARFANYIVILHADGTTGEYLHLMKDGVMVNVGVQVEAGDLIGYSGNTGFSSLPHLHFAVYRPKPMGEFESLPFNFVGGFSTRRRY